MSNNWDFYMLLVEDKPASIMVDLGIRDSAPIKTHPFMGYLRIYMNHPNPENGLSTDKEFEKVCEIGDAVDAVIEKSAGRHIYVGRNTCAGTRDFFFYTDSLEALHSDLTEVTAKFSEYEFENGGHEDVSWSTYTDFLFPGPLDYQRIQNRRVCENLGNHGDDLQQAREIDHWVYFQSKSKLKSFLQFLKEQKFEVKQTGREKPLIGKHFVNFVRVDIPANINPVVDELYLKCEELQGEYDGWGCTVVTE